MKDIDVSIIINDALVEQLNIKLKDIKDYSTLARLGADSLDLVELDILIEESIDKKIVIDDYLVTGRTTVKELTAYVKNLTEVDVLNLNLCQQRKQ